ncbi:MAG: tetratricopeptide repeat protein [Pelovirga sp.]
MTPLLTWKKIIGVCLFLLLFFLSLVLPAKAATTVTGIQKQEDPSRTRVTVMLSQQTGFSVDSSGQRIDLLLAGASSDSTLQALPEDGTVVRMTLIRRHNDLVVSILMRRAPRRVSAEALDNPARIVLDIEWVGDDAARPGIAFRMTDVPSRRGGAVAPRLQQQSPWEDNWLEFFRDYRSDWDIRIPQRLTPLPPLDAVAATDSVLLPLQQLADEGMPLSLLQSGMALQGLSVEERRQRDLMMGDAYLRTGSYAAGLARLGALRDLSADQQIRVDYLTGWGEAARDNAIGALLHLQINLMDLTADQPLALPIRLLHAEVALAASQHQLALDLLRDDELSWPDQLETVRRIRLADALAGLGERDRALSAYRELVDEPLLCEFYYASCQRAAHAAFQNRDFELSRRLYQPLALAFSNEQGADMVHFAAAAAVLEAGDPDWGWIGLERTTQDYPQSEGGDRAALRLLDIRMMNAQETTITAMASEYEAIGKRSPIRNVREEAFFKEILVLFLAAEHQTSVNRLMRFRRDFAGSPLWRETNILLSQQLPIVVEQLLDQENDLQAVVLVEQNRELLLASGYDRAFLNNLVRAFDRLGLYERSSRVLLYLFDQSAGTSDQQDVFLPLAQSFMQRDQYLAAGDYAQQYLNQYPDGADAGALFVLLIDSLERQGLDAEIRQWVERRDRPDSPEANLRAAAIYWQQDDFAAAVNNLERAAAAQPLLPREQTRLAESYYRLGNVPLSLRFYEGLVDDPDFSSQARYRSAQMLLQQGQRPAALEQLQSLIRDDANSAWGKLARDLLIQVER